MASGPYRGWLACQQWFFWGGSFGVAGGFADAVVHEQKARWTLVLRPEDQYAEAGFYTRSLVVFSGVYPTGGGLWYMRFSCRFLRVFLLFALGVIAEGDAQLVSRHSLVLAGFLHVFLYGLSI